LPHAFRDEEMARLLDEHANELLVVEGYRVNAVGGLQLNLSGNLTFTIFPDGAWVCEQWRLFRPSASDEHFVVTGTGIELV
jgi:hypothetical protein